MPQSMHDNFYSSQIWYWPARDKSAAADQFLGTNLGVIRIEEHLDAFRELRNSNYIESLFVYLHKIYQKTAIHCHRIYYVHITWY